MINLKGINVTEFLYDEVLNMFCDICWSNMMKFSKLEKFVPGFELDDKHLEDIIVNFKELKVLKFFCDSVSKLISKISYEKLYWSVQM